jgi:competence protein ComEC
VILLALSFTLGAIVLQRSAELPPQWVAALCMACGAACWFLRWLVARFNATPVAGQSWRRGSGRALRVLLAGAAAFGLGYGWTAWRAIERFSGWLDPQLEQIDLELEGTIVDLPQPFDGGVRLTFDIEQSRPADPDPGTPGAGRVHGLALLTWYDGGGAEEFPYLRPVRGGERWRFAARLRRPHANANPLVFDYEASLLEQGIVATGTVRKEPLPERLDALAPSPQAWLARLRDEIRDHLWTALEDAPYRGIILALTIGDQQAISNALWREFNRTGISHLMSISGLHVTMFAALAASVAGRLWRLLPGLPLIVPAQKIAAGAGFTAAASYCALAGFGVPAQRTLYMLGTAALALLFDRWHSAWGVLAAGLIVVLVIDPWAPLTAGFWLSFCAVAVLFYGAGGPAPESSVRTWVRAQTAVTLGLAPLTLAIFNQVSLVGPLVNAVAIPLVSLVVTPLSLVAAVAPVDLFARLAHALLAATMPWLDKVATLPYAVWAQHAPAPWTLALAGAGVCWILSPRGVPARAVGLAMMAPMLFTAPAGPPAGHVLVTVLDVGQGLAVVVRTHSHTMVYDPGPRYGPATDAGQRIVVPYLQAVGVREIDRLIVTHRDTDHSGGMASVLDGLPTAMLSSSMGAKALANLPVPVKVPCYDGQWWEWEGIRFEFIHPAIGDYEREPRRSNSMCCVLRISAGSRVFLLTADIEATEEARLVSKFGEGLHADGMLVPHHGSRTSSTAAFLDAVDPKLAIISAGYHNRFGHPRPDVVERYQARWVEILRTDRSGAVTVDISEGGSTVEEFRRVQPRYYRQVPN